MLAKYWEEYHHLSLPDFAQQAYLALSSAEQLPVNLSDLIIRMRQENWLIAYESREGLNQTIKAVSKRVSKPEIFDGAIDTVKRMDTEIEIAFRTFYPQLMAYSRIWTRQTPPEFL